MVGQLMRREEICSWLGWADIVHYHNRWSRQQIFQKHNISPPDKPSVIQMHSPKKSEDFRPELESGIPIAVIAQYHVRQWPELSFIVPNVVDIWDPRYHRTEKIEESSDRPVVSYAPSNWNAKGWDDKGYGVVAPHLKKLYFNHQIDYQVIVKKTHEETMALKRLADIGIDEVVTGSYHLSSLEYLSLGVACFSYIDDLTEKAIKDVCGCKDLPWVVAHRHTFKAKFNDILRRGVWQEIGQESRKWMEEYWSPEHLYRCYKDMYRGIS